MPSRRQLLTGVGITLVGGAAGVATRREHEPVSSSPFDWPMFQATPAGTGYHADASGPKADIQVAWEHDAPDWFQGASAPIRLGDTLYAVGNGLLALDVDSGERRFASPGPYSSSPAAAHAPSYRTATLAVTSTSGVYGLHGSGGLSVPGLDRDIGSQRWKGPGRNRRLSTIEHQPATPPIAVGETVYTAVYGTNDIVALDATDGTVRWRVTHHEDSTTGVSFGRPTVADGTLFVANWPAQVTAYDCESGTKRWQRERDDLMQLSTPVTDAGVVVTSRHGVSLLDAADGETRWKRDLDGNAVDGTAAVAAERVFLSDGDGRFHALSLETGDHLWSVPFAGETTPVVADGMVYAVEEGLSLIGFEAETGIERFRYEPPEVPVSPPIVGDGTLSFTNRGRIVTLEEPA